MPYLDLLDEMMAWEEGKLDQSETVSLFQKLVDNGMAWTLQGMYGREANRLIQNGDIIQKEKK